MIYWAKVEDDSDIPLCRVIVVNRNTRDHLLRCLESIKSQLGDVRLEVVVVDCGSTDGSVTAVKESADWVNLLELEDNPGYASAVNRAAEGAYSRYLLIMNSDVELVGGALRALTSYMEDRPVVGVCGPMLSNPDGSTQRSFNRSFPGLASALSYAIGAASVLEMVYRVRWLRKCLASLFWRSSGPRDVSWLGGACLMVRRDVFDSMGGMDETFFLYCEDTDLCRRVARSGYVVSFVGEAEAIHHWNSSIGKLADRGFFYSLQSTLIYYRKHRPRTFAVVKSLLLVGIAARLGAVALARAFMCHRDAMLRRSWLYWEALELISGIPLREWIKRRLKRAYLPLRRALMRALNPFPVKRDGSLSLCDVKKILVLRYDGLGDAVLTLPFVRTLKRIYPRALIYVLAGRKNSRLLAAAHDVYQVIESNGIGPLCAIKLLRTLRAEDFDLVIDPFITHSLKSAVLSRLVGRKYRCGFTSFGRETFYNIISPRVDLDQNMLDSLDSLARSLGWKGYDSFSGLDGCIDISESDARWAQEKLEGLGCVQAEPVIGIHPGGRYETQRWPLERFYRVALEVSRRAHIKVILFQGGAWREELGLEGALPGGLVLLEDVEPGRFIAVVGKLTLMLCNNSGPLHIARALGVPTISLTGPTRKAFLPVGSSLDWICETPLDCRPCDKPLCFHHSCLRGIGVDDVVSLTLRRLTDLRNAAEKRGREKTFITEAMKR